jgi:hypothetical protein
LGAYPFRDRRWDQPLLTIYGAFSGQDEPVYRYVCEYSFDGVGELIWFRDFKSLHHYLLYAADLIRLVQNDPIAKADFSDRDGMGRSTEVAAVGPPKA